MELKTLKKINGLEKLEKRYSFDFFEIDEKIYAGYRHSDWCSDNHFLRLIEVKDDRINYLKNKDAMIICRCGSYCFNVIKSDSYETSARCCNCGATEVVHDG